MASLKTFFSFSRKQQSHPKNPNDKHRSKKCKDPKPRVKKLKYHQYIPPDQKGEKNEPQMDSNYARLLQQQQLFLQLQILSQQQQHYNYQTILPAPLKYGAGGRAGRGGASWPGALARAVPCTARLLGLAGAPCPQSLGSQGLALLPAKAAGVPAPFLSSELRSEPFKLETTFHSYSPREDLSGIHPNSSGCYENSVKSVRPLMNS